MIYQVIDELRDAHRDLTIMHGGARGADHIADEYATICNLKIESYPANWQRYGRAAGPLRNKQMLVEGKPDLVIGFFDTPIAESRGTRNMIEQATAAGVRVRFFVYGKGWFDKL